LFPSKRPGFLPQNAPDFIIAQQFAELLEALREILLHRTDRGLSDADAVRSNRARNVLNSEGVPGRPVNETLGIEIERVLHNKAMCVSNRFKDIHCFVPCVSM